MTLKFELEQGELERRLFNVQFHLEQTGRVKTSNDCIVQYQELKSKYFNELKTFVERYEEIAKREA